AGPAQVLPRRVNGRSTDAPGAVRALCRRAIHTNRRDHCGEPSPVPCAAQRRCVRGQLDGQGRHDLRGQVHGDRAPVQAGTGHRSPGARRTRGEPMTRVITLGEVMLRLKSPQAERLFQSPLLEATFGCGEANVAVSLALFGLEAAFVTVLPGNAVGDAAIAELRRHGVDTSRIVRSGKRLGIYFLEAGTNQRPSVVIYDRDNSGMAQAGPATFDWESVFEGAAWFHISGIPPALSQSTADLSFQAVREAKARGITVSCDYNYRGKLWNYGKKAPDVMREL